MKWLPSAKEMLEDAAVVAARSFHYSKSAAEMGVEPNLASQWGQSVGNNGWWLAKYWQLTFTILFALGVFIFQGLLWLWAPVHIFGMWVLWKRYKEFRDTDPRIKLHYNLSTGKIVALLFGWWGACFVLAVMVNFAIPIMTTHVRVPPANAVDPIPAQDILPPTTTLPQPVYQPYVPGRTEVN